MRVRILNALNGVIEGRALSKFLPGYIYDVPEPLGLQLIEMKSAVEVRSTDPAVTDDVDLERLSGGVTVVPRDTSDHRPERRRRRKQ